jgi:hypothetical protein
MAHRRKLSSSKMAGSKGFIRASFGKQPKIFLKHFIFPYTKFKTYLYFILHQSLLINSQTKNPIHNPLPNGPKIFGEVREGRGEEGFEV